MIRQKKLPPVIKWAGGKGGELSYLLPLFPGNFNRYFEPFVGGGAVYLSIDSPKMFANDLSPELMGFYVQLRDNPSPLLVCLEEIWENWLKINKLIDSDSFREKEVIFSGPGSFSREGATGLIMEEFAPLIKEVFLFEKYFSSDLLYPRDQLKKAAMEGVFRKLKRLERLALEKGPIPRKDFFENIESALKGAFYTHLRYLYNNFDLFWKENFIRLALFYFLREFCFSSMFRYNKRGDFNVPYGGISYNRKDFLKKKAYLGSPELNSHLKKTKFYCMDFAEFFAEVSPEKDDFVFLDPPYDSDFSTYAGNSFGKEDQKRLAKILDNLPAKFLLVIKNSQFIRDLYLDNGFWVTSFSKKYLVSFRNRNDRKTEHLIITNYNPDFGEKIPNSNEVNIDLV